MDRREFLFAAGGAVAGAALAAAGVTALGRRPGAPSTAVPTFLGASHRAGPAPAPLPYLPLRLEDGVFAGAPRLAVGDARLDVSSWFRYCGLDAPGLAPNYAGTEKLSYYWSTERDDEEPPWFANRAGQHVAPEDFPTGRGARAVALPRGGRAADPRARHSHGAGSVRPRAPRFPGRAGAVAR